MGWALAVSNATTCTKKFACTGCAGATQDNSTNVSSPGLNFGAPTGPAGTAGINAGFARIGAADAAGFPRSDASLLDAAESPSAAAAAYHAFATSRLRGTPSPAAYNCAKLYSARAMPCAAALAYHTAASAAFRAVPTPLSYITAMLNSAEATPASAAVLYQTKAAAASCPTPSPRS